MSTEIKIELEKLFVDGLLSPPGVVESARDPSSPLHAHFDWDDTEAAEKWRHEQARQLIRSVKITISDASPVSVRAYVSLPVDRQSGAGYRRFEEVRDNEFLRRQLAADIDQRIDGWQRQALALGLAIDFAPITRQTKKLK